MKQLDILLPCSRIPADLLQSMAPHMAAPSLAQLLGRSKLSSDRRIPWMTARPDEFWLNEQFHIPFSAQNEQYSPSLAHILMQHLGIAPLSGYWFIIQPSHFTVGMNQITLSPYAQTDISAEESRALFDTAHLIAAESGFNLQYGSPYFWFLQADDWQDMCCTSPAAIQGNGVDSGLPQGTHARYWRKLHNHIQMSWYNHPVNTAREANNLLPVNGLWLWGGSSQPAAGVLPQYDVVFSSSPTEKNALQTVINASTNTTPGRLGERTLWILNDLMPPCLEEDWGQWLNTLNALDKVWISRCLKAFQDNQLQRIHFILSDLHQICTYEATPRQRYAFWKKPSLKALQL